MHFRFFNFTKNNDDNNNIVKQDSYNFFQFNKNPDSNIQIPQLILLNTKKLLCGKKNTSIKYTFRFQALISSLNVKYTVTHVNIITNLPPTQIKYSRKNILSDDRLVLQSLCCRLLKMYAFCFIYLFFI